MKLYNACVFFILVTNKILFCFSRSTSHGDLLNKQQQKREFSALKSATNHSSVSMKSSKSLSIHEKQALLLHVREHFNKRREVLSDSTTTTTAIRNKTTNNVGLESDDSSLEPRQYCGETLYYALEYYCTHLKGINSQIIRRRRRRFSDIEETGESSTGIVDECCYKECRLSQLAKYCN